LLTDYGTTDAYVGTISGAILRVNPRARLVTITHEVSDYDIPEASYLLNSAAVEFPPGTVFLAIVDPGVGSSRRGVALETKDGKYFVGPDNGIFSDVIRTSGLKRAHSIDNVSWIRKGGISTTFHGRDIFGPAAAYLTLGAGVQKAGAAVDKLVQFQRAEARLDSSNLSGHVIHRDHYGNLITNIPAEMAAKAGIKNSMNLTIRIGYSFVPATFESRYSAVDSGKFVVVINSQGRLEIARNLASAGDSLEVRAGEPLMIYTTGLTNAR
jgi:S-adenosylmethionine hydrolase